MYRASILIVVFLFSQFAVAADTQLLGHKVVGGGVEKVIVLHDWMGDSSNYDGLIQWLDLETHTYIFADIRGYGKSRDIPGDYNSEEIANDVLALSRHLGLTNFHLVGHSMSGLAGFKTILRDWEKDKSIKSYIAIAPVTPDGYPASKEDKEFLSAAITDDAVAQTAFSAMTGGKLGETWAISKTARNRQTSSPEVLKSYYQMWLNEDFSKDLISAQVNIPVLVIGGRNDLPGFQSTHFDSTLKNWLPNIEFHYVSDAGHYPMEETPVLTSSLIQMHIGNSSK